MLLLHATRQTAGSPSLCAFPQPPWWKLVHKFCQQCEAKSAMASADDEQAIQTLAAHLRALAAVRQLQWSFRGWTQQQRREALDRFVGVIIEIQCGNTS